MPGPSSLLGEVDRLCSVTSFTWRPRNAAAALAARLGIAPAALVVTADGGTMPQKLLAAGADAVASGEADAGGGRRRRGDVLALAAASRSRHAASALDGAGSRPDRRPRVFGSELLPEAMTELELAGPPIPGGLLLALRERSTPRARAEPRGAPSTARCAVGLLRRGGSSQPLRLDPERTERRRDHPTLEAATASSPSPTRSSWWPTARGPGRGAAHQLASSKARRLGLPEGRLDLPAGARLRPTTTSWSRSAPSSAAPPPSSSPGALP